MIPVLAYGALALVTVLFAVLARCLHVIHEHEAAVVYRFGRLVGVRGPGVTRLSPFDRFVRVNLQSTSVEVPQQWAMTMDSINVCISMALYIRVSDPARALTEVDDYEHAVRQVAQTTLRNVVSQVELDELLLNREKVSQQLQEGIDRTIQPFGVVVKLIEVNDIVLPDNMLQAMARDAEAERDRRSKVIKAQGESEAADALNHAAEVMERHPAAMQLRILSAMAEVAGNQNTTVVIPVPVELLRLVDRLAPGTSVPR